MNELRFFVSGKPISKARPRVIARGVRCAAYTPAKTRAWENTIRWVAKVAALKAKWKPTADPCELHVSFRGAHPLSDLDNLFKATADALNGVAYDDDRRLVRISAERDETLAADGALVIVRRETETKTEERA